MKLISLTMHNFMPFRDEQRIAFPGDPSRNVMMVFGNNMFGKTSLLNALRWGFYGIAMGRHLRTIPLHLLHNIDAGLAGDWGMEVALEFETEDGHHYDLHRKATKRKLIATPERPEDFDVHVFLKRDGIPVTGSMVELEINKFVPEQVSRFFLFDGELLQEYETLLIEGDDQGRRIKDAIEQCLGVPALIHGREDATILRKKAQKQQTSDLAQLLGSERHVEQQRKLQAKVETLENDLRELKEKLQKTKDERSLLDDEIDKNDSLYRAKLTLDDLKKRQTQIIKEQSSIRDEKLELAAKAWRDLLRPKLQIRREQLNKEQRCLVDEIGRRRVIEAEIRQIEELLKISLCPTCGQEVSGERRNEAGSRLGSLQGELHGLSEQQESITSVSAEISILNRLISQGVGELIRDKDRRLNKLDIELTRTENEMEVLTKEIGDNDPSEIARKRAIRDALFKEEGSIESKIDDRKKFLERTNQDLAINARQLGNLPRARAERSSTLVDIYTNMEKAFGESIERLRENLRNKVETNASDAFRAMITQQAYSGLQINKNYGLTILDENNKPVPVRSSGAEQIVALSLIDGLSRSGRTAGPVVMDTPFGRLDLKHRDNILRYLPTTARQLVLLVHDGEIRKDLDLAPIASRIGATYNIVVKGPRHSIIERSGE